MEIILYCNRLIYVFYGSTSNFSDVFCHYPEDRMLKPKVIQSNLTKDVRINKVFHHDWKNDFHFFILLLTTAITATDVADPSTRTIVYGVIYFCARVFYAFAYVFGWQPWRTIGFIIGLLCTFACSLDLVITMSLRSN